MGQTGVLKTPELDNAETKSCDSSDEPAGWEYPDLLRDKTEAELGEGIIFPSLLGNPEPESRLM